MNFINVITLLFIHPWCIMLPLHVYLNYGSQEIDKWSRIFKYEKAYIFIFVRTADKDGLKDLNKLGTVVIRFLKIIC